MRQPTTDKQRHWAKILEEAESSGQSLADYARANNLRVQTLYQWRSELKARDAVQVATPQRFSQVMTNQTACALSIEINTAQLRFDRLPDARWLSELIRCQENRS